MALPEWRFLSKYGSQVLAHLPEMAGLAVAEVDAAGMLASLNGYGGACWGWEIGHRLPNTLMIALSELEEGEAAPLPVQPGGLSAIGVRMEEERGWLLFGYRDGEAPAGKASSSFKTLIEKIPVLVLRMQADGTIRYANAEAFPMTGYAADEITGRPFWLETVHPEDRWKLMGAVRRTIDGEPSVVRVRFLTRREGPRFAEMHLFPVEGEMDVDLEGVVFDVTERSEVEEALFQSEALYRTFLEQSPIGMLHLDGEGTVTFENHPFRQIVGESVEDAWIGRTIYEIPGLDPALAPLLSGLLKEGEAFHGQAATYRRRGRAARQQLVVHGSPIRHPEGGIVGGVLMFEDVTEQRRRDEELHLRSRYSEAESALRKAALADPGEDVFLREAAGILGRTARADRTHVLLHAQDGLCTAHAAWDHAGAARPGALVVRLEEHPLLEELRQQRCSLHARYSEKLGAPARSLLERTGADEAIWTPFFEDGALGGFVLFERTDARVDGRERPRWQGTELELIERLVRLFEALWAWIRVGTRYRQIVATIDDGLFNYVFTADGGRRYLFITHQVGALTGYLPEEVMGRGEAHVAWVESVVHPADRADVRAHDRRLRGGQENHIVYRVQHRNGTIRWLREHGTPQRDATGRVTVSGILTDVTEQKAAEAVLVEAKQQAESANQLKSAFMATMSHEIRTPMGAVNGFADLLIRELAEVEEQSGQPLPPQITEFVRAIRDNSQKLLTLVNDLFDLSNLEVGSIKLRRISIPLHDVVMRSTSKVAVTLSQKGVDLRVNLDAQEPIVLGDPPRLEQVLDNILANAAKFTSEGSVTVRTRRAGEEVVVEIQDTGVGISQDYLERIFTPFMQEDSRLNRKFEGTGLGLALVRSLLDLMGGRIEVESEKGAGSTFRIFLEAAGGEAVRSRKAEARSAKSE